MVPSNSNGWGYISHLFSEFLRELGNRSNNSHIAPSCIYRGISKRYFTESKSIYDLVNNFDKTDKTYRGNLALDDKTKCCLVDSYSKYESERNKRSNQLQENSKGRSRKSDEDIKLNAHFFYDGLYSRLIETIKSKVNSFEKHSSQSEIDKEVSLYRLVYNSLLNKLTMPEQIRSGASVRLRDIDNQYYSVSDYIRYIKNLIIDFKTMNPGFKQYDELEILAEIQHRGGASCLVDFSNNFLISLWFACNNNFSDIGYVFCYDVNADALLRDNITYLNKHRWEKSIENLLLRTRKSSRYLGLDKFRFWLWKPENINGRIARQDSVFVFGLEKFYVQDHGVIVLPILPHWKEPIILALRTFFGITAESVFPDPDGYSTSHSKISKIPNTTSYINPNIYSDLADLSLEVIQRGMSCLINGNYQLALDYFLKSLNESAAQYKQLTLISYGSSEKRINLYKVYLEVLYSTGFCYKKLGDNWNAYEYLLEAYELAYELITGIPLKGDYSLLKKKKLVEKCNSEKLLHHKADINQKFYKIIDDLMDVLYDLRDYPKALVVLNHIQDIIEKDKDGDKNIITCSKNCIRILSAIKSAPKKCQKINEIKIEPVTAMNKSLCSLLNRYLSLVAKIVNNPDDVISHNELSMGSEINNDFDSFSKEVRQFKLKFEMTNMFWDFTDISKAIDDHFDDNRFINLREFVKHITAQMISIQNIIQSNKSVNSPIV